MDENESGNQVPTPVENLVYSKVMEVGVYAGLAVTVVGFGLLVTGALPACLPMDEAPNVWHLSAQEVSRHFGIPTGLGWLGKARCADILSRVGLAMLSSTMILAHCFGYCHFMKKRDRLFANIVLVGTLILLLAVSGLTSGGH